VIRGIAAAATDAVARGAAEGTLASGGSAADAVIAAFFAAAGGEPSVLLGPAVALVLGGGAGARAFDGRSLQPGLGASRPRGLLPGEPMPAAARATVPRAIAMLSLLHMQRGRAKLRDLVRAGVEAAEEAGALDRARILRSVGDLGALTLRAAGTAETLVAAAGSVAGGTLTSSDLEEAMPSDDPALAVEEGGVGVAMAPWDAPEHTRRVEVVVAVDAWGLAAGLVYAPVDVGVPIPELQLVLDGGGIPVLRGTARLRPGTALAMPAPLGLARVGGAKPLRVAVAARGPTALEPEDIAAVASALAIDVALSELLKRSGANAAVAVVGDARTARAFGVPS
jgi:hypothetical protein